MGIDLGLELLGFIQVSPDAAFGWNPWKWGSRVRLGSLQPIQLLSGHPFFLLPVLFQMDNGQV